MGGGKASMSRREKIISQLEYAHITKTDLAKGNEESETKSALCLAIRREVSSKYIVHKWAGTIRIFTKKDYLIFKLFGIKKAKPIIYFYITTEVSVAANPLKWDRPTLIGIDFSRGPKDEAFYIIDVKEKKDFWKSYTA